MKRKFGAYCRTVVKGFKTIKSSTWRSLYILFLLFVLPTVLFVRLTHEVFEHKTLHFDVAILETVHRLAQPWLDALAAVVTNLGGAIGVMVITAVVSLLLLWRLKRREFLILVASVGGAALLNVILKLLFQRDRPALWERVITENSYSFPSGHAMASSALALSIIVLLWSTKWRWWAVLGGLTYVFIIGFTRMYLGLHYPTDIVAGWLVSAVWVALVAAYLLKWQPSRKHKRQQ